MAYVNVLEWKAHQVAEWLQGLDDTIYPYAHSFLNNNVTGKGLLNVTVDDLYKLQVEKLGHQEIILEALEHLRNLHHNLDTENLQYVCLKLSCKARSLANELRMFGPDPDSVKQSVDTGTMSSVADVMDALWVLISWLDRPPFNRNSKLDRENLIKIGIELATTSARDTFAEKPINKIQDCCSQLADLSDQFIREVDDPLILQPSSLDIATVRRRPNDGTIDFGLSFNKIPLGGVHVISEVRFQSPAHQCGRIHPGDEVVQVNYQTVVGWTLSKILQLMDENPSELILTLKKRPRHLPVFGQIYMKPFRIPARAQNKKGAIFNNLPSPRAELLVAPNISIKHLQAKPKEDSDGGSGPSTLNLGDEGDSSDDDLEDAFLPPTVTVTGSGSISSTGMSPSKSPTQSVRSLLSRPRSTPQRRATISGSSPSLSRPYINISEVWQCHARNIKSVDHSGKCPSSNTSTLASNDSGHATMCSPRGDEDDVDLRKSSYEGKKYLPGPLTVGGIPTAPSSDYINMDHKAGQPPPKITTTDCSSDQSRHLEVADEYINMSKVQQNEPQVTSPSHKAPMPKPRMKTPSLNQSGSPSRKKPIPQPRSGFNSQSTTLKVTKSIKKSLLPEKPTQPQPTAEFQSFRKPAAGAAASSPPSRPNKTTKVGLKVTRQKGVTESLDVAGVKPAAPTAAEYINTTPPAVPARNPARATPDRPGQPRTPSRRPSELLQQSKQPSSRRFSIELTSPEGEATPPSPLPYSTGLKARRPTPLLGHLPRRSSMEHSNSFSSITSIDMDRRSSIPPSIKPPQMPNSALPTKDLTIPYYVSDVVSLALPDQDNPPEKPPRGLLPPPLPTCLPPGATPSAPDCPELPPAFTPSSYSMQQEMHQRAVQMSKRPKNTDNHFI